MDSYLISKSKSNQFTIFDYINLLLVIEKSCFDNSTFTVL